VDGAIGVLVVILVVWAIARVAAKWQLTGERAKNVRQLGAASHAVSGEFPTTCQWCRETALARKMFVLRRENGSWTAVDVAKELGGIGDPLAAATRARSIFSEVSPGQKRLCSEKCVREFLGSEGVAPQAIDFRKCEYCGGSVLVTSAACQGCGARNAA